MSKELVPEPTERSLVHAYRTTIELGEASALQSLLEDYQRPQNFSLYMGSEEEDTSPIKHLEVYCQTQSPGKNFALGAELKFIYNQEDISPLIDSGGINLLVDQGPDLVGTIEENLIRSDVFSHNQIHESAELSREQKVVLELSHGIFALLRVSHNSSQNLGTMRLHTIDVSSEEHPYSVDIEEDELITTPKERLQALIKFCSVLAHAHDAITDIYSLDYSEAKRHLQFNLPGGKIHSHQKSLDLKMEMPVRELIPDHGISFDDIAGYEDIKQQLLDLALVYEHPEIAKNIGLSSSHGVVLHGPPGTGKTSLLKAFASELQAECIEVPVSEVIDKYVGQSAKNVDEIFTDIKDNPDRQVILMDEFDSLGTSSQKASSSERVDAVNRLKEHIVDIVENYPNILLTAATNDIDRVDETLLRPGRMNLIEVPLPSEIDRRHIWALMLGRMATQAYLNKHRNQHEGSELEALDIGQDIDTVELAKHSHGLVGAHFNEILNAIRRQRLREYLKSGDMPTVGQADLLNEINKANPSY